MIAAYGTLRKGMYNFNRFDLSYIETREIKGFKLFDLGPYPYAIYTEDENDSIIVDMLDCDKTTNNIIDRMEIGAGYKILSFDDFDIYVFEKKVIGTKEITNGDYVTYTNNDKRIQN